MSSHSLRKYLYGLIVLIIPLFMLVQPAPSQAANSQYSLGLSLNFTAHQVVSMTPGQTLPPTMQMKVYNNGPTAATVEFKPKQPAGITLNPDKTTDKIPRNQSTTFNFGVTVDPSTPAGDYEVSAYVKQTNVPAKGGTVYAPAVGATFVVKVVGDSGSAHVRAVIAGSDSAITGDITVGYKSAAGGSFIPVKTVHGSELTTDLAAGDYAARFVNNGQQQVEKAFTVNANQTTEVVLEVQGAYFLTTAALPQPNSSNVVSAKLVASIENKLAPITTPVAVQAVVSRDGDELETVDVEKLPGLQTGATDVSETYVPADGWQPGTYTFTFQLITDKYTVTADAPKPIVINGGLPIPWIALGAGVAAVIIFLIIWIRRKSKRDAAPASDQTAK